MAGGTALLAGVSHLKGRIAVGHDADLVIFAPEQTFAVTNSDLKFRHAISPYVGQHLQGRVKRTYLRGQLVYDRRQLHHAAFRPRGPALTSPSSYALDLCARIAACTDTLGSITRLFLSPATWQVHAILRDEMEALGMTVRIDAAGNLRGLYSGSSDPTPILLTGSHVDTVPNAGSFDGVLGIAIPLAVLRSLEGRRLPFSVEVIAFSEEEGIRFRLPFIGSRAVVGNLAVDDLARVDEQGITVEQALRNFGLDPAKLPLARITPGTFAFVECHIEQGPVLEALNLPLGIVTAIVGQTRLAVTFSGSANHAGTTPMHLRRDALACAAAWISVVEQHARNTPGLVATVGMITVLPNAANVIAGEAVLSLDLRHPSDELRAHALDELTSAPRNLKGRREESRYTGARPAVRTPSQWT